MQELSKSRRAYKDEELQFIRDNWQDMTDAQIGEALGRSATGIKVKRQKMGLVQARNWWTAEEEAIVLEYYADTDNDEILAMLDGCTVWQLYRKAQDLGVHKSDAYMKAQQQELGKALAQTEAAKANRFNKGDEPANKGKKQEEYMSAEAIEATKATRFKDGRTPHNTKWDGAISIRHPHKQRGVKPSVWIRHSEGEWEQYTRYQYRKHFGPIPDDMLVALKDGNPFNCYPENLELITRAENARRNRNPQKATAALREWASKHGGSPSKILHPNYVAGLLAGGDEELKEYLLNERPDVIRAARANYKLRRSIHHASE